MTEKQMQDIIKRKLSRYNSLTFERMQLEAQLAKLEATMTAPKVQNLDGMPKASGGGDAMTNLVAELVSLQAKYKEKLVKITEAQTEVEDLIESLEPNERLLMRCRYLEGMVWEEVCVVIGYSWRQTHNIHSKILDKLVAMEMASLRPSIDLDELSKYTDSAPIYALALSGVAKKKEE